MGGPEAGEEQEAEIKGNRRRRDGMDFTTKRSITILSG
jgi:hypothetical protein